MGNKVNFGLKNAHFSPITIDEETGEDVYGTPIKLPGSVELSLEPRGDMVEFFADDMLYYSAPNNQGYDGTLTIANIPEEFSVEILGEEKDEDDLVLTEKTTAKPTRFAFMFEFDGDVKATRHVLYNCTANRPNVTGSTKTDSVEPQPNELTFVSSPRGKDDAVKTKTLTTTPNEIYNAWYNNVYEKAPAV
ncbi:phage tail protein [Oceanobacillus sp. E9]|uniref:major tail protein n=1 Tax=Oceanobacillus sp. E9 TaxID=1742575 RepID=UPI00084E4C6E|nr:major tail protein [Oceanobacillus sp. E9]OEH52969.1 phage tail protein [Oceanobacillus sp. E9]